MKYCSFFGVIGGILGAVVGLFVATEMDRGDSIRLGWFLGPIFGIPLGSIAGLAIGAMVAAIRQEKRSDPEGRILDQPSSVMPLAPESGETELPQPQDRTTELEKRVLKLEKQNAELEKRIAELEKRIAELEKP